MFRYGGMSSVPGAPGNLMAGSPGYIPSESQIQDRLFRYGLNNTPLGDELKQKNQKFRDRYPNIFSQVQGIQSVGNMGGMEFAQSQFPSTPVYYDEQMKQLVPRPATPSSTPVKNYPGLGIAPKVPFV